jgi:hypothetical protein
MVPSYTKLYSDTRFWKNDVIENRLIRDEQMLIHMAKKLQKLGK